MNCNDFKDVTGDYSLHSSADYVVALGKKMWIFRHNGELVACRPDICNAHNLIFLADAHVLVGSGKKAAYRLVLLEDGTELWNHPESKKKEISLTRFALSPDMRFAYEIYVWMSCKYAVKIDLQTGDYETHVIHGGYRSTDDLMFDSEGRLCVLQTHYENVSDIEVSQNGILYQYVDMFDPGSSYYWKFKWTHERAKIAKGFLDSTELILTADLYVYEPKTGNLYYLLENSPDWVAPEARYADFWLDYSKRYIILKYCCCNVVIDWEARKMVARYVADYAHGCLVDNEYWIPSKTGIRRASFPLIEELPGKS